MYAAWSPVPFMDDWDAVLSFVMDVEDGVANAWWRQHNEHRMILVRLLLYPVMTVLGGRLWLLSAAAMASVAGGVWLLTSIARQGTASPVSREVRSRAPVAAANRAERSRAPSGARSPHSHTPWLAMVAGSMWLWSQHETLEWGLNVTFVLALLTATAAVWLQGRGAEQQRGTTRTEHVLAAALGISAAGTIAGGLAVLPLLAFRAWWTRASARAVGGYVVLGALTATLYLNGYASPPSSGSPLAAVLTSPLSFGAFVSLFLGGSVRWLLGESRAAAVAGGLAGVAYVLLLLQAGWQLRRRQPGQDAAVSLWCLSAYVLLLALLIAAGRTQVFGIFSALASRYNTIALWGWAALGLLALRLDWLQPHDWSARRRGVLAALCALVMVRQLAAVRHTVEQGPGRSRAGLALALHVDDPEAIQPIYPVPERAIAIARRSEQHRIGFLAHAPYAGLRDRLGAALPVTALPGCRAALHIDQPPGAPDALQRISGHLFSAAPPNARQAVTVVDAGVIVGFLTTGWSGSVSGSRGSTVAELVGYATLSPSSHAVLVWDDEACGVTMETRR